MRLRQISLAIALAATALVVVSTAAFADTLSVSLTTISSYNQQTGVATGSQTSTLTPGSTSYTGTFSLNTNLVNQCLIGPVVTLSYPSTTPTASSLTLTLNSPLCQGSTATFTITHGTGVFASATGGGSVTYTAPETFNFIDSLSGGSFLGASPSMATTPELDSLLLFGTGALGLAGYGLTRVRAGRKQRSA